MAALDTIPTQRNELARMLITLDNNANNEWWYNRWTDSDDDRGNITGDYTIVEDPTAGETDVDVALTLATFRWYSSRKSTSPATGSSLGLQTREPSLTG